MFLMNLVTPWMVAAAALSGGNAASGSQDVPSDILDAAQNEVRNGRIVAVFLDREITTSQVYRVIMDTPDWDRRLTIRWDGVVLNKQRLYEPAALRVARR